MLAGGFVAALPYQRAILSTPRLANQVGICRSVLIYPKAWEDGCDEGRSERSYGKGDHGREDRRHCRDRRQKQIDRL